MSSTRSALRSCSAKNASYENSPWAEGTAAMRGEGGKGGAGGGGGLSAGPKPGRAATTRNKGDAADLVHVVVVLHLAGDRLLDGGLGLGLEGGAENGNRDEKTERKAGHGEEGVRV